MAIHQILVHRFNGKAPELVSFQTKVLGMSWSYTSINLRHKCDHASHLSPTNGRLNRIFKGGSVANTSCTKMFFWFVMLYKEGYWFCSGVSASEVSSQNLILRPSPSLKDPLRKKSSISFMRPFQKGESVGLAVTCDNDLSWRYLLCSRSCHTPSSFKSLLSHLLSKHLFLTPCSDLAC